MAKSINKVIVLGNLGNDPEVSYMPNGTAVAKISVATSQEWIDKNTNEKKELTEWHRIVCFGKLAEIVEKYIKKGSKIHLEGYLKTHKWTDKGGVDHWMTEIVGKELIMLDPKPQQAAPQQQQAAPQQQQAAPQQQQYQEFDDDIPF